MSKKFYKITNEEENHYGMRYKDGLNVDIIPFNPSGSCEGGGLYFSDKENILRFLSYGVWIREVTLPENEEVYKDPDNNKWKAHRIILGSRRSLKELETYKWMKEEGINLHTCNDVALRNATFNGRKEIVKYLVEQGANINVYEDKSLRSAAYHGHLEIVKYLVEQGADIHACCDESLRWAAYHGHLEIVKYLVEQGADIHAYANEALKNAAFKGHKEIVAYLKSKGCKL